MTTVIQNMWKLKVMINFLILGVGSNDEINIQRKPKIRYISSISRENVKYTSDCIAVIIIHICIWMERVYDASSKIVDSTLRTGYVRRYVTGNDTEKLL